MVVNEMVKEFELPINTVMCPHCGHWLSFDDEDVTEFDERIEGTGDSLFWTIACPICEGVLIVLPESCMGKAELRRREIIGR